jgi:Fe-S-cluster formation regulator IscX/YfhJ
MKFDLDTRASPEQVLEAMTDFTDRRTRIWKTLDPRVYEVRERGDTWAVAREGSPRSPYWVVVRYDWSDPRTVRWTELETNLEIPATDSLRLTPMNWVAAGCTSSGAHTLCVHETRSRCSCCTTP